MTMFFAHGKIAWLAADAVNTTYVQTCTDLKTGKTFQPKAIRFYWQGLGGGVDAVSQTTHSRRGIGFWAGLTDRRAVATQDQDAAGTSICTSSIRNDAVVITTTSTPADDGLLDVSATSATGFTAIVDDQGVVDLDVFWEAWGSDDATMFAATGEIAEPAATGTVDYTVGFTPAVVMFAGISNTNTANNAARFDSYLSVGAATGPIAEKNITVVGGSDDASTAMDTDGYCQTGECHAMIVNAGGNPNARARLSAWNQLGFQLNWLARATSNRRTIYLAVSGGQWLAGSVLIDGNTSSATTDIQTPFDPIGVSLMGRMTTQNASATATADDRMGLGTGDSPSSRRSMGHLSENATASSACEIDLTMQYDQVLCYPDTAGALLAAYDINSFGNKLIQLIVDTAGGVASEWIGFLAFGGKSGVQINNYQTSEVR